MKNAENPRVSINNNSALTHDNDSVGHNLHKEIGKENGFLAQISCFLSFLRYLTGSEASSLIKFLKQRVI